MNNKTTDTQADPYFDDLKPKVAFSFDFVIWFYRVLKHWYLFIISLTICLGIAYVKNKSWVPYYRVEALMMLDNKNSSIVASAVPVATLLKSVANQQFVLSSYGMTKRAVENLPLSMHVDYYALTRYKKIDLYSVTPVRITILKLQPEAYDNIYTIEYRDEQSCHVFFKRDEDSEKFDFSEIIYYGKEFNHARFKIRLDKTKFFTKFDTFNFEFLTDNNLIDSYSGRVSSNANALEGAALTISMTGTNPDKDVEYLNVLLGEFQKENLMLKNQQADSTINFIDKQLVIINDSLDLSRKALDSFQRETGVYDLISNSLKSKIEQADVERDKLEIKEKSLLVVTDQILNNIKSNVELIDPEPLGIVNANLSDMIKQYNDVIKRGKYLGVKNPLYPKTVEELNTYRKNIAKELLLLQTELQTEKDIFTRDYGLLRLKMENLPPQERALVRYQRAYKVNEMYEQYLTQKKYEAQINKASNTPDNFIWEAPRLTSGPTNGGFAKQNNTYYFMIGMILPLIFVVLKEELLNFTLATKEECEKIAKKPVIGAVENVSKKLSNGPVLVKNYPKSSFAESFRNMRIRIEYLAKRENKFAVLVTSAEPGDGKTFIATNIASAYQLMGKKVVIVDLDLRRPSVGKTLQLNMISKGVSNYLIGQVELKDIIMSSPDYGFDIISAGTLPPNPSELIKTEKTKELINILKEMYDYVIIDCSPVGLVSDAYILGRIVDVTLFTVRRAKTNRSFFKSVINQLKIDGIENFALVFNDVKGREGYYGTSRYYGDRSYYFKKNSYYHDDYYEN